MNDRLNLVVAQGLVAHRMPVQADGLNTEGSALVHRMGRKPMEVVSIVKIYAYGYEAAMWCFHS